MFINGTEVTTIEELEVLIASMSEDTKTYLRNIFNGVPNSSILSQKEVDFQKYLKRASVKDQIIAEMAAENMERVRAGVWSVVDLVGLTQDAELKLVLDDINTLSFELAQSKLSSATNPLLTQAIKTGWILKLQANLFN
jgi:hypothetical protein